jgi:Protein of unknown function DUF262
MNISSTSDKLQEEIDRQRQDIRSDSYSMSIGELVSLYESQEIEIHPEFQRFFRWSDYQKTSLIESILLGIPIPPIFVSQRDNGEWDVIDGLQRLSTIYQFLGKLKDDSGKLISPLVLQQTKYLPSLENKKWEDKYDEKNSLTKSQQLLVKRAKINVVIIQKESSSNTKYELFQRLNSGGSICTPQEVRSCILVSINPSMYQWMKRLSENEDFKSCINLSETLEEEQYNMEILSKFLILRNMTIENQNISNIAGFITDKIQEVANNISFDYKEEEKAFNITFKILNQTTKEDTFRKYNPDTDKFSRGFLSAPFEVIATGIGYHYQQYESSLSTGKFNELNIKGKIKKMWENEEYQNAYGRGKDAKTRVPKLIPLGRELFTL